MKPLFLPAALCALLISCASSPPAANQPMGAMDAVDALTKNGLFLPSIPAVSTDPAKTHLPIIKAVGIGTPKYEIMADASYVATYRYGQKRYFKIIGTHRKLPTPSYPPVSKMKLMDQVCSAYATGNEDPEYTSEVNVFSRSDRTWVNAVFIHGGNRDFNTSGQIEKEIPIVTW